MVRSASLLIAILIGGTSILAVGCGIEDSNSDNSQTYTVRHDSHSLPDEAEQNPDRGMSIAELTRLDTNGDGFISTAEFRSNDTAASLYFSQAAGPAPEID